MTEDNGGGWRTWGLVLLLALLVIPSIGAASFLEVTGQPGSVPWRVADVKPGFHGTGTVSIANTGSSACSVVIWVGNITGDHALGQYMLFSVSGPRLATPMTFPATIYDFPTGPDDPRAITVSPVSPGETVRLDWTWQFKETGRPQNEAQGKQLGFVVYYTMLCSPPDMSGWYYVMPRVFRLAPIPGERCHAMNQTLQEYRVYTCTMQSCSYVVTDHRWLDLGRVFLDADGDGICDADEGGTPTPTATVTAPPTTTLPVTTAPATTVPFTTVPTTGQPTGTVPTTEPTPLPTIDTDLCPPLAVPTGPVTVITGPTVIAAPGFYVLGDGAVNTTAPVFIDIRASDVTLDGMGRTVDGVDRGGSYGIRAGGDGPLRNIVVQNVTVSDFAYGIALFDASHGLINRVGSTSNTYDGVMILGGGDNQVACSLIDRDDDGINMTATARARVVGNTVTENVRGSGVHVGPGCRDATVLGNLVGGNDEGIEVEDGRGVAIRINRIYGSRYRGLNLTGAGETTVIDNYLCNRENVDRLGGAFSGAWSQTPAPGPNVMGNPMIGGNYWGTPDGTGFSDVTPDRDRDGFADGTFVLPDGLGTDFYPLGPSLSPGWTAPTARVPAESGATPDGSGDGAGTGAGDRRPNEGRDGPMAPADATTPGTRPPGATPTATGTEVPAGTAAAGFVLPAPGLALLLVLACLLVLIVVIRRRR